MWDTSVSTDKEGDESSTIAAVVDVCSLVVTEEVEDDDDIDDVASTDETVLVPTELSGIETASEEGEE